jgi:hypothetical protein
MNSFYQEQEGDVCCPESRVFWCPCNTKAYYYYDGKEFHACWVGVWGKRENRHNKIEVEIPVNGN